jgi:hypothetical protein
VSQSRHWQPREPLVGGIVNRVSHSGGGLVTAPGQGFRVLGQEGDLLGGLVASVVGIVGWLLGVLIHGCHGDGAVGIPRRVVDLGSHPHSNWAWDVPGGLYLDNGCEPWC